MKHTAWLLGAMGCTVVWLALAPIAQAELAAAAGWPNWRGPDHNGISLEKGWLSAWPTNGPRRLWEVELGPGHADPAVCGGRVYVMGRTGKQDIIFCLNADTGETVWKYAYEAAASAYGGGPRATPAVDGKVVYTLSADGQIFCLDTASGQVVWNKNIQKELNLPMPRHNFSTSPVIEGDLVLLNLGASGLALDKKTGNVVWRSDGPSSYSSPVPFTLEGKRCMALSASTQLVIVALANGQKIASYERKTLDNANCADPVVVGDAIFVTSGYNVGSALIGVRGDSATVLWKKAYGCVYASPVLVGDYLYMLIESGWQKADLVCVSVKDGSVKWTQKNVGSGGLMVADGKLIVLSRGGDLIVVEASPAACTEIARAKVFATGACWNGPVLCGGCIFVRNEKGTLVCLDVRSK